MIFSSRMVGRADRVIAGIDTELAAAPAAIRNGIKTVLGALQPGDGVMLTTGGSYDVVNGVGAGDLSINISVVRLAT